VSLNAAGGAEQILALLDRGLVAAGHRSIVIAAESSHVDGSLIPLPAPRGALDDAEREPVYARWRTAIAAALNTERPDLLHFHGLDFYRYLPPDGTLALVTLHLPRSFYPEDIFRLSRPRTWLNCVSVSQRSSCPESPLLAAVIENGIAAGAFDVPNPSAAPYVLALGRICPEKGFHLAVEAAGQAGVPLYLAGRLFPYPDHVRYWREVLRPRLHAPHRFLGPVGLPDKARLMAAAVCLLVPSLVAETSSLVAMEALASGTPVVAFPSGALPDLIEPCRTGFLVRNVSEMAWAIHAARRLDRTECREVARKRFSSERMVNQYIELYRRIASTGAGVSAR
jgi:glycosyltransferase involved in cell wall biosynthesis